MKKLFFLTHNLCWLIHAVGGQIAKYYFMGAKLDWSDIHSYLTTLCLDQGQFPIRNILIFIGQYREGKKMVSEPPHDKTNKKNVRPAKTQISLGIRTVWSESLLCTQCVAKDTSSLHADSEDSDQTGRMPRLIWVFAGRTCHFVCFVMRRVILFTSNIIKCANVHLQLWIIKINSWRCCLQVLTSCHNKR